MTNRRPDLVRAVLAIAAAIIGVWLGLAGADISPVFTEAPLGTGGPLR
jgi:hypothetical protein